MPLIQLLVDVTLSLALSNPLFVLNEYIKNLQTTNDPDTYLLASQMVAQHGYQAQTHVIPTPDEYLLELVRIPFGRTGKSGRKRQPVLICHAFLFSSSAWLLEGPEKSLGFQLADAGYDVWLVSFRGTRYSRSHVTLTPKQKAFWNFSIHELGIYDVPASVDYILQTTGFKQIVLIGHSSGSGALQIMASELPQYNDKIKAQIHLGPITALPNSVSIFKVLVPLLPYFYNSYEAKTAGDFGEHDLLVKFILQIARSIKIPPYNLLDILLFLILGYDPAQFNQERIPVLASNFVEGASIKLFAQLVQSLRPIPDGFAQFDYGPAGNIRRYGTRTSPPYNVSSIKVPFRLYYGTNDVLADPKDCKALYEKVPEKAGLVELNGFSHLSFLLAKDLKKLLNDDIIQYIDRITHN